MLYAQMRYGVIGLRGPLGNDNVGGFDSEDIHVQHRFLILKNGGVVRFCTLRSGK